MGVSGSCEDREVTSLPEELPREPDSEKETWEGRDTRKKKKKSEHTLELLLLGHLLRDP